MNLHYEWIKELQFCKEPLYCTLIAIFLKGLVIKITFNYKYLNKIYTTCEDSPVSISLYNDVLVISTLLVDNYGLTRGLWPNLVCGYLNQSLLRPNWTSGCGLGDSIDGLICDITRGYKGTPPWLFSKYLNLEI